MEAKRRNQAASANPLPTPIQRVAYRITVRGAAGAGWPAAWGTTAVDNVDGTTTLTVVVDQAALRGILCQLWDLNTTLIAAVWADAVSRPGEGERDG